MIPKLLEAKKERVIKMIDAFKYIAMTEDTWIDGRMHSFLNVLLFCIYC